MSIININMFITRTLHTSKKIRYLDIQNRWNNRVEDSRYQNDILSIYALYVNKSGYLSFSFIFVKNRKFINLSRYPSQTNKRKTVRPSIYTHAALNTKKTINIGK